MEPGNRHFLNLRERSATESADEGDRDNHTLKADCRPCSVANPTSRKEVKKK